jgi:hypothetical protein
MIHFFKNCRWLQPTGKGASKDRALAQLYHFYVYYFLLVEEANNLILMWLKPHFEGFGSFS